MINHHNAKIAEETDLEKCNFPQFSELQKPHDLDLGLGAGHISMHSTGRTTSIPNRVSILKQYGNIAI